MKFCFFSCTSPVSTVQCHLYLAASELDSMNVECFHPHRNFYYHYSVFPAQLLKLLFLHLSHLFTLGRPGSRAGGWHITRPEAHGNLSTWLRCPGSCNTSSWTLALVKVSPELGTGKATVPGLAPDWNKATLE